LMGIGALGDWWMGGCSEPTDGWRGMVVLWFASISLSPSILQ
jgi:hypothetical protein